MYNQSINKPIHSNVQGLISKQQSLYIKGIAIILMFVHHLFTFPDRYPQNTELISLFGNISVEHTIGWFGKYCVAIFLFISGYGFSVSKKTDNFYYLGKIVQIYKSVWLVFAIYIPLDIYFDVPRVAHNFNTIQFIFNLFGISNLYNGEWWFILPYILMVAITPLLQQSRRHIITIIAFSFLFHNVSGQNLWGETLVWQSSYVLGFVFGFAKFRLNNLNIFSQMILFIIFSTIIWNGFILLGIEGMIFLVPFVIFCIQILFNISSKIIRKIIMELGDKCLFMWLTHSFYCYHFAGKFIYSPKYTILILINLLVISYFSALILNYLYRYWDKLFSLIPLKKFLSI